jgi:hypothetical protein
MRIRRADHNLPNDPAILLSGIRCVRRHFEQILEHPAISRYRAQYDASVALPQESPTP